MGDLARAAAPVQYAETLVCRGVMYEAERKFALAENALTGALKTDGGAEATDTHAAKVLELLVGLRVEQKRFPEPAGFAELAYGIVKTAFGDDSPNVTAALASMALVE